MHVSIPQGVDVKRITYSIRGCRGLRINPTRGGRQTGILSGYVWNYFEYQSHKGWTSNGVCQIWFNRYWIGINPTRGGRQTCMLSSFNPVMGCGINPTRGGRQTCLPDMVQSILDRYQSHKGWTSNQPYQLVGTYGISINPTRGGRQTVERCSYIFIWNRINPTRGGRQTIGQSPFTVSQKMYQSHKGWTSNFERRGRFVVPSVVSIPQGVDVKQYRCPIVVLSISVSIPQGVDVKHNSVC